MTLSDEQIQDLLRVGNPTDEECQLIRMGWDAAMQEIILRLEAAEKSDAESLAMYRKARDERDDLRTAVRHESDCVEAAKAEIKALRAKIAEMEQQKQKPASSVPTGWKLVPIDPTRNMLDIMDLGSNMLYRYRALLAAAPGSSRDDQHAGG